MKFYFCETCGKRVTEQDVESGRARNKKLNGVFCTSCAAGVLTMEMLPVSEDEARKILNKSQGASTPPAGTPAAPGSSTKNKRDSSSSQLQPMRRAEAPRPAKAKTSQSVVVGVAAGLGIAGIFVLVMLLNKPKPAETPAVKTVTETKPEPVFRPPLRPFDPVATPSKTDVPPASAPTEDPAAKTDPKEADPAAVAPPEADPDDEDLDPPASATSADDPKGTVLATIRSDQYEGRSSMHPKYAVMFGLKSDAKTMAVNFELAEKPPLAASLWLRCNYRHLRTPYEVSVRINGQNMKGSIPVSAATSKTFEWHEIKLDEGVLRLGKNELRLSNNYNTGQNNISLYVDKTLLMAGEPEPAAATPATALKGLATLQIADFTGGVVVNNFWNQGKDGRAIWGARSSQPKMSATFTLDAAPEGDAVLRVVSLRHERKEPVTFAIEVNGKVMFSGADESTTYVWTAHDFKLPAGTLTAGKNTLVFKNLEDTDTQHTYPWYMINKVAVLGGSSAAQTGTAEPSAPEAVAAPLATPAGWTKLGESSYMQFTHTSQSRSVMATGLPGNSISGVTSTQPKTSAIFPLAQAPKGAGMVRMKWIRTDRSPDPSLEVFVNERSVYRGGGPAKVGAWEETDLPLPDGVLTAGDNRVTVANTTAGHKDDYYINRMDLFESPNGVPAAQRSTTAGEKVAGSFKRFTPASTLAPDVQKTSIPGYSLWGTEVLSKSTSATLTLAQVPAGACRLRVKWFRTNAVPAPTLDVQLNDRSIYNGAGPDKEGEWKESDLPVPAGLLVAGENRLTIANTTAGSKVNYYVHGVDLMEAPAAIETSVKTPEEPATAKADLITADQRAALKFYDDAFTKLRNQLADEALAAARASKLPEARPLAALLERAAALNKKALEEVNRKPPTTPVTFKFKGEELTGQLKRVEGSYAWVVSKGLEVRVALEDLPSDLMLGALALDPKSPEGRYDLAAFHASNGHLDQALAAAASLDAGKYGDLLAMLKQYQRLTRLHTFEQGLKMVEDAIREAKSAEAQQSLAQLRRTFPELAEEYKARLEDLDARAEGAKLSSRVRSLFSNVEVLALRDDLYIELKYNFQTATRRDDWIGDKWTLTPDGLHYNQTRGDIDLKFKARFQAKAFRAEAVQTPDHDITYFGLGKLWLKIRWPQNGQIDMTYEERYSAQLYVGKPWKEPAGSGTYRYIVDRSDTEMAFFLDATEHYREKLPAQALQDKNFEFVVVPQRSNTFKEIVLKGYLDREWVAEALKAQAAIPAAEAGLRPGLWTTYYDGEPPTARVARAESDLEREWMGVPDPKVAKDFSVVMTGFIRVLQEGEYELSARADDYISLAIDDKVLCEVGLKDGKPVADRHSTKYILSKGYHSIQIKFVDIGNVAWFKVRWRPPNGVSTVIPADQLFHDLKQEKQP